MRRLSSSLSQWLLVVTIAFSVGIAASHTAAAQGITITIAIQGDVPPDMNGFLSTFNTPVLNDVGQVAFGSTLIGTSGGANDDYGIFRGSGGPIVRIARESQFLGIGLINLDPVPAINNSGEVVLRARATGLLGGNQNDILRGTGGALTVIATETQAAPDMDGNFSVFGTLPAINDTGQVAFRALMVNTGNNLGIFRGSGGAITQIVRRGQAAPNNDGTFLTFEAPALNEAGQAAFHAVLTDTSQDVGIFRGAGGAVTRIARRGQIAPDANGSYDSFGNPTLNQTGQVAFSASLINAFPASGIFRGAGGVVTRIAQPGDSDGGCDIAQFLSFSPYALNDAGQAAFLADLTPFSCIGDRGIFRGSGGPITLIVVDFTGSPDGNGEFTTSFGPAALNGAGQVAFLGELLDTSGMTSNDHGIFLGDGQEKIIAAREGQPLAGSTISVINFNAAFQGGQDLGGRSGLNEFAQVAYTATLQNGKEGVFLFTPELHWRTAGSGAWDDQANWTIGTDPAHVHPVLIDPDIASTVTGPTAATTVRSLQVGGGMASATLQLQSAGPITSTEPITVESNGTVSGEGQLIGNVSIFGTLSPGASAGTVMINGDITFNMAAQVDIELGGLTPGTDFDRIEISGQATLAGTLDVSLINPFVPVPGNTFEVMTFASRMGEFTMINGLGVVGLGAYLYAEHNDMNLRIVTALPGDGNLNGEVEAADYTIWANGFGMASPQFTDGDYNTDGMTNAADYTIWANNFGQMVAAPETSAPEAVPEPSTFLLAIVGTLGLSCYRRRRRRQFTKTS